MLVLLLFILGLVVGSFIGAYSYREPKGISINDGRSRCPSCKHVISWYDNIPVISYLLLKGKCRNCHKKISLRYPIIELATAVFFAAIIVFFPHYTIYEILYTATLVAISVAIVVIDLEHQIIPDELVWIAFLVVLVGFFVSGNSNFYARLAAGFGVSLFLLFLNLVTKGKGMGLGDVKLVIPFGFVLGFPLVIVSTFLGFLTGAVVGVALIALGKGKLQSKIAFGPFLIVGFWLTLFFGDRFLAFFLPSLLP